MNHNLTEISALQSTEGDALAPLKNLSMPDQAVIARSANAAMRMAESFVITTPNDYELCADELKNVKAKINALESKRTAITGPMNIALKAINDLFRGPMEVLKSAETKFKTSMLAYDAEQERLAALARAAAEKIAAAERKRMEDEARRVEQAAQAESQRLARIEADRVAAAKAIQDQLAAAAAAAAAAGNAAAAAEAKRQADEAIAHDQLAQQQAEKQAAQAAEETANEAACLAMIAAVTTAPVVYVAPAKAVGTSIAKTMDYEVVNLLELVKHIAVHPELISLLMTDSTKLRAYVRGLGMNTNLPGVKVFEKRTLSARA